MKRSDFEGICHLAESGAIKWVDNLKTQQPGRVVSCSDDMFEVELRDHRETWSQEDCKERTYGYKIGYEYMNE